MWTKTADQILESITRYCTRTNLSDELRDKESSPAWGDGARRRRRFQAVVDGDDSDEAGRGKASASTIGASVRGRRRGAIIRRKVFMVSRVTGRLSPCAEP